MKIEIEAPRGELHAILDKYLEEDFDFFRREEINSTVYSLQSFQVNHTNEENFEFLLSLISEIITRLYAARGYLTSDTPRDLNYYQMMDGVRNHVVRIFKYLD